MQRDCRLYLLGPVISDAAAFAPALTEACTAGDIAALLLRFVEMDEHALIKALKRLTPIAQAAGAAVLVAAPPRLALRGNADGIHVGGGDASELRAAIEALKPDRIVGAGGLGSKDDAMTAGEAGVDYVMFGEPRADGSLPPLDAVIERAEWWAEVFAVPCVAVAPTIEAVADLAATGAEFVALGDCVWGATSPAVVVRQALAAIAGAEVGAA